MMPQRRLRCYRLVMITIHLFSRRALAVFVASCIAPIFSPVLAQPTPDALSVETVAEGLDTPWHVSFLPDGRWLVTERGGQLRLIENGVLWPEPVTGVPPVYAASQGGLFETLPAEDFADSNLIYLSFAHGTPQANATRVVRARLTGRSLSEVEPIFTAQPLKDTPVHYGGRMDRLADGTLVLGLGDGFDYREAAQRLDSHLGKTVRIHADGSVPADNPFVGQTGALPEIYTLGNRNVQGVAFDAARGIVWAHEHGPKGGDELNRLTPGGNYGWPLATHGVDYTGARISPFKTLPGMLDGQVGWTPSIAPSGLAVVRGPLFADWQGDLLVSSLAERSLRRIELDEAGKVVAQHRLLPELNERLRDVQIAPDGAIIVLSESSGRVLRLTPQ